MSAPALALLLSWLLALSAAIGAIEWPPPDLRLLRLWKLAGRRQPLTAGRWFRRQLLCCGAARGWLRWLERRRARRMQTELPGLVDRLCIALGCGLDWPAALALAAATADGADICGLLHRGTLVTPAPLAVLARELRRDADALGCLLRWSRQMGIAAYDLGDETRCSSVRDDVPGPVGLQWSYAAQHPGHA